MIPRLVLMVCLIACGLGVARASAAAPTLTLSVGETTKTFTAAELLARPDAAPLNIPADVSYRQAMTYRAVPLLALIGERDKAGARAFDTIEARASDGFVSQLPAALIEKGASGGAVAWIAVEDPAAPWPHLPGREASAGPFYLVWEHPERSGIGSEQWPFALAALTGVEDPVHRWPQLAVDPALPPVAPERRGQAAFIKTCIACHRFKGAGEGDMGPDLGQPMNVTRYMTPAGLRALIRDPKSVRTWPQQQMPGFDAKNLPDADLDALMAFLTHMAK